MPHNGTIDYGQEIAVVVPDTPVISVVHLEEVSFAKAVRSDTNVHQVVIESTSADVIVVPEVSEVSIELRNNGVLDLQIVTSDPVLSDYDLALIDLYAAYGTSYGARDVLNSLGRLVNTHLYNGTNGIVV